MSRPAVSYARTAGGVGTDATMKNEVLCKFLCHNLFVIHQAFEELRITATF